MTIELLNVPRNRATFKISVMPPTASWAAQSWVPLPVPEILTRDQLAPKRMSGTVAQGGFCVDYISRATVPDEDMAAFYVDFGTVNGVAVSAPDYSGYWVRMDVQDNESFPTSETSIPSNGWKCVFLGYVYNIRKQIDPTNRVQTANGRATYYCAGLLSRTRLWPLKWHAILRSGVAQVCSENPGYNYPLNGLFREVIGTKSTTSTAYAWPNDTSGTFLCHETPVDAASTDKWTDEQAIKHALASSRQTGTEPFIEVDLSGATSLFNKAFSWPVNAGDTCLDFIRRVCNRQRGRGCVYLDWNGDDGTGSGALSPVLKALPSFGGVVDFKTKANYQSPSLTIANRITGQSIGADSEVDLCGDHRLVGQFQFEDRSSAVYDYIELVGERIQTVANLHTFGGANATLINGWSASDASAFNAETNYKQRIIPRFRHVYRRFFLPRGWDFRCLVDSPSPSTSYPSPVDLNYCIDDDGGITFPPAVTNSSVTARLLGDLPIYEGKRYDQFKINGQASSWSGADDYLPPSRMPILVLYQADQVSGQSSTDHRWVPLSNYGFNLQVDDWGVLITYQGEDQFGYRVLANGQVTARDPSIPGVTGTTGLDPNKLLLVMGVELSNRVRMAGYTNADTPSTSRRMYATVSGLHLWVGSKNVIWECDPINAFGERYPFGLRFPNDTTIIRDDRDQMSFIFGLMKKYYGEVHNPGQWTLADCGLRTSFSVSGGLKSYPGLGKIISTVAVTPTQKVTLNTPVTSIYYDHNQGVTTWRTDYVNYEVGIQ